MGKHRSRSPVKDQNPGEGSSGVPTSNRFAVLPIDGHSQPAAKGKRSKKRKNNRSQSGCTISRDDATATNSSDVEDFGDVADTNTAKVKLPPLVVKNVHLNDLIADLASLGVKAEFKLGRVGTKVMLRTKADYDLVVAHLRTSKVEFFTHDIPGEKPFKVVIRGLPNFDPKLIEAEIKNRYKLAPTAVFRMTRRDENVKRYPDCLFLVHFQKGSVKLNALKAIRSINSIIVRWEPYRGGRQDVTQCQRCLNFGHGTRNCFVKPRCGKCAQNHISSECVVDESETAKCANCNGAHQGSDKQCPKREDFKRIRKQASTRNQPERKKDNTPAFRLEDFPSLSATQHSQANPRVQSGPRQETSGASAGQSSPPPPGFWRQPPVQNANPDLFSADELIKIFVDMTSALRQCRSKPEQIQVLGKFIIQYGV